MRYKTTLPRFERVKKHGCAETRILWQEYRRVQTVRYSPVSTWKVRQIRLLLKITCVGSRGHRLVLPVCAEHTMVMGYVLYCCAGLPTAIAL